MLKLNGDVFDASFLVGGFVVKSISVFARGLSVEKTYTDFLFAIRGVRGRRIYPPWRHHFN